MALRNVRLFDDEILRKKSKPVKNIDSKIIDLLEDMWETLHDHNGIGLSAPQIGILKRIAIIEISNEEEEVLYELINPEIIVSEGSQIGSEGCLSIPGMVGKVDRPQKVTVKALDRSGKEFTIEATDLLAVALCHEIDHLDGILYSDKAIGGIKKIDDNEE